MRLISFASLLALVHCQEIIGSIFRFTNGTLIRGNESSVISGTVFYGKYMPDEVFNNLGVFAMDYSTMTPFIGGEDFHALNAAGEKLYDMRWGRERIKCSIESTGFRRRGKHQIDINGRCTLSKGLYWSYNATANETEKFFYPAKEAGLRAKLLIGQSKPKYEAYEVIDFAVMDAPYYRLNCSQFLTDQFPEAPGPEPGAIIVGTDGAHCGILDNEGTKFIHTNPVVKKVTYDSIAAVRRYFPKGVAYKRYPLKFP